MVIVTEEERIQLRMIVLAAQLKEDSEQEFSSLDQFIAYGAKAQALLTLLDRITMKRYQTTLKKHDVAVLVHKEAGYDISVM